MEPDAPIQPRKNISPAATVFVVVAAALLSGGGTYAYQRNRSAANQSSLQSQIDTLKSQVAAMRSAASPSPSAVAAVQTTPAVSIQPSATPVPSLTLDQLKNTTYLNMNQQPIKLVNGTATFVADSGIGKDGSSYSVNGAIGVDSSDIAFGDLDGDGIPDAAVILGENDGGTGEFDRVAAVLNKNGDPSAVGYSGANELGDRATIKSITIDNGIVTVNALVTGPNDSLSDPTLPKTFRYKLIGKQLVSQ